MAGGVRILPALLSSEIDEKKRINNRKKGEANETERTPQKTNVYGIYNTVTRTWYIGQSIHPRFRFDQHMMPSADNCMTEDREKYGKESFRLVILSKDVPLCWAGEVERAWYNSCNFWCKTYNKIAPSTKGNLGLKGYFRKEDFEEPKDWWRREYITHERENLFPPAVAEKCSLNDIFKP